MTSKDLGTGYGMKKDFSEKAEQGRHHVGGGVGGGGFLKSWTLYPGKYSDLSEGAAKTR